MKKIKINIKLNKRGKILLFVALFCLSTVITVILIGAFKAPRDNQQSAGLETELTPAPEQNDESETDDSGTVAEITPTPEPAKPEKEFIFPKQGVRPIAVMIDNETDKVLPQGGIGIAQIVYEMIVEYGDTRYMAIFWDNLPDLIGPVRSSRHYFLDYLMEYDAIYAHIGWSDYAYRDLEKYEIDNIDGVSDASTVYWDLTTDKSNYHDSYTKPDRLNRYIERVGYSLETDVTFPFSYHEKDTDLPGQMTAGEVFIKYHKNSTCGYYYDPDAKNYKRTRQGEYQIDRNTNEIIRVKNIIIMFVRNEPIPGDKQGRHNVYTVGSGEGFFITNGKAQKIKWSKASRTAQTKYRDENGNDIVLNPGQTWIQVVPLNAEVRIN
ncbi:MAG: DUF3048 domain-containing protein [Clostridiaceae bacterium]|nr:DUF3048 domain-containing protein [Clostridiaceae bacterium]